MEPMRGHFRYEGHIMPEVRCPEDIESARTQYPVYFTHDVYGIFNMLGNEIRDNQIETIVLKGNMGTVIDHRLLTMYVRLYCGVNIQPSHIAQAGKQSSRLIRSTRTEL